MFQRWRQSALKPFRVQRARNIQLQEAYIQGPLNSDPENPAGALSSAGSHQSSCHNKTLDLVASPPTLPCPAGSDFQFRDQKLKTKQM